MRVMSCLLFSNLIFPVRPGAGVDVPGGGCPVRTATPFTFGVSACLGHCRGASMGYRTPRTHHGFSGNPLSAISASSCAICRTSSLATSPICLPKSGDNFCALRCIPKAIRARSIRPVHGPTGTGGPPFLGMNNPGPSKKTLPTHVPSGPRAIGTSISNRSSRSACQKSSRQRPGGARAACIIASKWTGASIFKPPPIVRTRP